jgi:hypothetical protein
MGLYRIQVRSKYRFALTSENFIDISKHLENLFVVIGSAEMSNKMAALTMNQAEFF